MQRFDTIIVGAGIIGSAITHQLAKTGFNRTLLIDSGPFGGGSTGSSAAMIRCYHGDNNLTELAADSIPFYTHLEEHLGAPSSYINTGSLYFELTQHLAQAVSQIRRLQSRGVQIEILNRTQGEQQFPMLQFPSKTFAIWEPTAGYVNPKQVTLDLVKRAQSFGASAKQHVAVRGLITKGNKVLGVETDAGAFLANQVIMATGGLTNTLLAQHGLKLPIQNRVIQFNRFEGPALDTPHPLIFNHADFTFSRPDKKGSYIGCRIDQDLNSLETGPLDEDLAQQAKRLLSPTIKHLRYSRFKGGIRATDAYAPGRQAIVGYSKKLENLFFCVGWSGTGFKCAPAIAKRVCKLTQHSQRACA